jgi:hypothetical protein
MSFAGIAQLVERLLCKQGVGSSSLSAGTISKFNSSVGKSRGFGGQLRFLLRWPLQVSLPWLPARPVASVLALKHRSRPSLGTILLYSSANVSAASDKLSAAMNSIAIRHF